MWALLSPPAPPMWPLRPSPLPGGKPAPPLCSAGLCQTPLLPAGLAPHGYHGNPSASPWGLLLPLYLSLGPEPLLGGPGGLRAAERFSEAPWGPGSRPGPDSSGGMGVLQIEGSAGWPGRMWEEGDRGKQSKISPGRHCAPGSAPSARHLVHPELFTKCP